MFEKHRLCCYCYQYKKWVWLGKRLRDGSKLYVDERNARWAGKRCPDCERKRVRAALKCTSFERELIFDELRRQGFEIVSFTFPLKVRRDEQNFSVGVRYAITKEGKIVLEEDGQTHCSDLYVVMFASARMITKEQVEQIQLQGVSQMAPLEMNLMRV